MMTEKRKKDIEEYAGEKQPSMKRRSDINDYHGRHIYLVTLAVEGRRPLLGQVVGNPLAAEGSADAPRIELSALGGAVFDCWQQIPERYPEVEILALQIMPDHLHGILWIKEEMQQHLGRIIGGFKTGCNRAYRFFTAALPQSTPSKEYNHSQQPGSQQSSSLQGMPVSRVGNSCSAYAVAVPQLSQQSQQKARRERRENRNHGLLFEPNYNDLICKSYDMLPTLINYVKDNPRRLLMKRTHPEYLRPFFDLRIGSHTYSGIGNLALLRAPHRLAVRVSRRNNEIQLQEELHRYMNAAQSGTVLISPAISPGEKRVMRAAFDAKLPTIVILENGFTPLSKPHGEQFYACAEGRLLMLSPWPHHNDHQKITAQQCQAMNLMALELATLES
ncbi:MAG: hypothetical protein IJ767_06995 [Bacteroidaceae bacterium]|nr:hypothetical protein [Bacteroidaceae bacterium]MBR1801219.1 hypothetical protein [Bacteroidaceae bacterium]